MTLKRLFGALALLLTPALAFAHPGHGDNGLIAGLGHPIGGLDHLLAMLAVGLWAAQQQGAARWALPCTFVGTMLLGGLLGFEGLDLPALESGIAASVLALGLAVALAVRPPLAWRSVQPPCLHCSMASPMAWNCRTCRPRGLMRQALSQPRRRCMAQVSRWCGCCLGQRRR